VIPTSSSSREIAEENLILLSTVGSVAHGLNVPGDADRDLMGVCIEPPSRVIGLQTFEQDVYRTQPEGTRSGPGDEDRTVYSCRKFCRLALGGNPTIITLLYITPYTVTELGQELIDLAPFFAARSAGRAFLGYMTQQRQRLLGERGQMNVKRPELVDAHGYDTKYAMHMLRLGYQGVEFLETGRLTMPMREEEREFVYSVRCGEVELNEVLTRAGELEQRVEDLLDTSPLPAKPSYGVVNDWLVGAYRRHWGWG
jgi:predicted nucleotidyltransferase